MQFEQNIDRDTALLYAGMRGGFEAVCYTALVLSTGPNPEMKGGPDTVLKHADWLKAQPSAYREQLVERLLVKP